MDEVDNSDVASKYVVKGVVLDAEHNSLAIPQNVFVFPADIALAAFVGH